MIWKTRNKSLLRRKDIPNASGFYFSNFKNGTYFAWGL
jgi:hypothetical protein